MGLSRQGGLRLGVRVSHGEVRPGDTALTLSSEAVTLASLPLTIGA